MEPFFRALSIPRILPSTEEMISAARDSSSVAGKYCFSREEIG